MSDDKVIDLKGSLSIQDLLSEVAAGRMPATPGGTQPAEEPEAPPIESPAPVRQEQDKDAADTLDLLSPLPRAGDPYKAHSRISARPVPSVFFLGKNMLPDGYTYGNLERVYFEEAREPGAGPVLIVRFNGSEVREARIKGRNLIPLATYLARQLIHWVRVLPPGVQVPDDTATVVSEITIRLGEQAAEHANPPR